ncbi:MAG TPA: ABC transporter permease subunit [Ruminiclostridium sp.]
MSKKLWREVWRDNTLYLMMLPAIAFFIIYRYIPMYGIIIAFKKFNFGMGIINSPWIGLENFQDLFRSPFFSMIMYNTITISFYKLVLCFPLPIIVALMLNQVRNKYFKSSIQTVIYLPYFISWIVVATVVYVFLSPDSGVISKLWADITGSKLDIMMNPKYFRGLLIFTEAWKETGWGTIIYLASLSSINSELYEAADIDGASRLQGIFYITIPSIMPAILTMLILRVGYILNAGFEQIFVMQNAMVYQVSEILDTYVYKTGFQQGNFGLSTAVGLFKSIVGLTMVVITNNIAKRFGEDIL